ncbi:MAG: hypothetical protein IT379_11335 [Deltaproteobacteria bacterium]|nr:hypothetical protein [Deltaproteobacteria bacterium]
MTRRCAARAAIVVVVFAGVAGCDEPQGRCSDGLADCAGTCVSLLADERNCGVCGRGCAGDERCLDGVCEVECHAGSGATRCGGECADIEQDPAHCGSCDTACDETQDCVAGRCVTCTWEGRSLCGERCVDLSSDAADCGVCDAACVEGSACVDGACTCALGELCDRECTDTSSDEAHCGACDAPCEEAQSCVEGACVCPAGLLDCEGHAGCHDPTDSSAHCGACDVSVPSDARCDDGSVVCAPGTIDCDGWPDRMRCEASAAVDLCSACNDGVGCLDGATCGVGGCSMRVEALELDCGGPHRAGALDVMCRAALRLTTASMLDVTGSTFLRWSQGECQGPVCAPAGNPDAPAMGRGGAARPGAGRFLPAGHAHPELVTSEVALEVRARYQLGTTDVEAAIVVRTVPR